MENVIYRMNDCLIFWLKNCLSYLCLMLLLWLCGSIYYTKVNVVVLNKLFSKGICLVFQNEYLLCAMNIISFKVMCRPAWFLNKRKKTKTKKKIGSFFCYHSTFKISVTNVHNSHVFWIYILQCPVQNMQIWHCFSWT